MDRLVDHLLVFEGDGNIRDFPGNYSQYRIWQKEQETEEKEVVKKAEAVTASEPAKNKRKLSYKEQREFEQLEKDLAALEKERKNIYEALANPDMPYDQLQQLTERIGTINNEIDEKEMRWLELSEVG